LVGLVEVVVRGLGHAVVARADTRREGHRAAQRSGRLLVGLGRCGGLRLHALVTGVTRVVGAARQQREILHRLEGLGAGRVRRLVAVPGDDRLPRGVLVEGHTLLLRLAALLALAVLAA